MKKVYDVTGMTCASCSAHVEKAAKAVAGVEDAVVSLMLNRLTVEQADESITENVLAAVKNAGYGASVQGEKKTEAKEAAELPAKTELKALRKRLVVSLCLMIPMMYLSMAGMLGLPLPWFFAGTQYLLINAMTQILLALPVLYINRVIFVNGFKRLWQRQPNMDSLIAVGSGAALVYGLFSMYRMAFGFANGDMTEVHHAGMELYFESSVMILTLITLGKYLETRAKGKTGDEIRALMELAPDTAWVERDGETVQVPVGEVVVGDHVVVRPGERVPVDGVLTAGVTAVDQSAITGESIPVDKTAGDSIIAGSVNRTGAITLTAQKVGQDTTLMQIIHLVEDASATKAPIAKLADKIAGVFVPVVMGISLVTLIVWLIAGGGIATALSMAIAVLVISCPCALGLATPVAIMAGTGVGAKHGVLIKSAEALETAHAIDTVVLDKTGTITEGKPKVAAYHPAQGVARDELLQSAVMLERSSEHPLAKAVIEAGQGMRAADAQNVASVPGKGLRGTTAEGETLLGGTLRFMQEENIPVTDAAQPVGGETLLHFARGGRYLGSIAVADAIKPTSPEAVAALKKLGIRVLMMTGDSKAAAKQIAQEAGVDETLAEVLPQDKEKQVAKLMAEGHKVAMIGDGINDAPALTRADVGIAIGAGTDIAMDAADIVLVKSDLRDVPTAIRLSRMVLRNIKENLFWAFFYNCIGIPLAAGVFYPIFGWKLSPMFAAAAMSFSSVFVVTNSLRIRSFKAEKTACDQACPINREKLKEETKMEKKMLVEGMHCGHCKAAVEKAIGGVHGVSGCVVDLEAKTATITLAEDVADSALMDAVKAADFTPVKML